jgi:hypothetical protein
VGGGGAYGGSRFEFCDRTTARSVDLLAILLSLVPHSRRMPFPFSWYSSKWQRRQVIGVVFFHEEA